ncbi:MAG: hypothetical protein LBE84_01850 [Planctomycetota bacterium]|jgi:hypothetical protein|nr:hypothetical protein [Planctomycetota bacterium]
MEMRGFCRAVVLACFGMAAVFPFVPAMSRDVVVRRPGDFQEFFLYFQSAPDKAVPNDLLARCYGVIVT